MARLVSYDFNAKDVPWDDRLIYHWTTTLQFTSLDKSAKTFRTNQRNMVTYSIEMAFLFPIYYAQNPIGNTSEPCEHIFGELRWDEREFTMYRLLRLVKTIFGRQELCTKATWKDPYHRQLHAPIWGGHHPRLSTVRHDWMNNPQVDLAGGQSIPTSLLRTLIDRANFPGKGIRTFLSKYFL